VESAWWDGRIEHGTRTDKGWREKEEMGFTRLIR